MRDVRQPVLIVQGDLDTQVPPHHGEKLAELARARKRKVAIEVATLPSLNHLLVPAKTGEVDEYARSPRQAGVAGSDCRHQRLDHEDPGPKAQLKSPHVTWVDVSQGGQGDQGDSFSQCASP